MKDDRRGLWGSGPDSGRIPTTYEDIRTAVHRDFPLITKANAAAIQAGTIQRYSFQALYPMQMVGEFYLALSRSLNPNSPAGQHDGRTHRAYEATVNILKSELKTAPDKVELVKNEAFRVLNYNLVSQPVIREVERAGPLAWALKQASELQQANLTVAYERIRKVSVERGFRFGVFAATYMGFPPEIILERIFGDSNFKASMTALGVPFPTPSRNSDLIAMKDLRYKIMVQGGEIWYPSYHIEAYDDGMRVAEHVVYNRTAPWMEYRPNQQRFYEIVRMNDRVQAEVTFLGLASAAWQLNAEHKIAGIDGVIKRDLGNIVTSQVINGFLPSTYHINLWEKYRGLAK